MVLNVSQNKVPVILSFPSYPQLLVYPKVGGKRTTKSISFDMTKTLNFKSLLLWVLGSLGNVCLIV